MADPRAGRTLAPGEGLPAKPARARKRGRPPGSFTQHRRADRLLAALESTPGGMTVADLAASLRITERSVRRYLDELKVTNPIESFAPVPGGAHVWRIKPSERGRTLVLRRTQAYALLATRRLFDVLRGSALFDEIDGIWKQLEILAKRPVRAGVRGEISAEVRLDERFFLLPSIETNYSARAEDVDSLFLAVAELRELRYRPRPATRGPGPAPEPYRIWPFAMVVDRGTLKCLASPAGGGTPRFLALDDMVDLVVGERTDALPDEFDVKSFFEGALGVDVARTPTRVVVEFDAETALGLRNKKVHSTQRIQSARDGRIRMRMDVANVEEAIAYVLGFGERARVVEPPELVERIAESLRRTLKRYEG